MAGGGLLDGVFRERPSSWRWAGSGQAAPLAPRDESRNQRLRWRDAGVPSRRRLKMPLATNDIPRPFNADWAWRPQLWQELGTPDSVPNRRSLGDDIALFHDGRSPDLKLCRPGGQDTGLCIDISDFDGSFLSVVVDLPRQATRGLKRTHILRMDAMIRLERNTRVFARINIKHGPNTAQNVRELPATDTSLPLEFDLAYMDLNERRIEKAWVDLIFDATDRNRIVLNDLTFCRRPRAAF